MVVVDPAFQSAGKSAGLEIWRIKDFNVYPLESTQFGTFYGGDSYIVLSSFGADVRNLQHNVHMWLGEDTTMDESGTAAIKMVELDDLLWGSPVQYREMQNHESPLFLGYFKKGIRYMKGGHDSGFKHFTKKNPDPRLFHVKGKRIIRVQQVDLSHASLNTGDVFILDVGPKLYVWMPPQCNHLEKLKGVEQARGIRDQERSGRAEIEILDSDWDTNRDFWKHFEGDPGAVKSDTEVRSDEDFMKSVRNKALLWRVSDASGKLDITKVGAGTLEYCMLDSKDAFILDTKNSGIFVWIGKKCTMNERRKAMNWATEYLRDHGRPKWVQTVRVLEGAEPAIFHQWFVEGGKVTSDDTNAASSSPGSQEQPDNTSSPKFESRLFHCSDASGRIAVQEISNFTQEDLQPDDVMIMDACSVVYVWNGEGANDAERHAGIQIAKTTAQIEVTDQGEEGELFMKQFTNWNPNFWKQHQRLSIDDVFTSLKL